MNTTKLINAYSPEVRTVLTEMPAESPRKRLEAIFYYVRDEILFGFEPEGDFLKASEVITRGRGQCNNKSTLVHALCKASGISSRIHYSLIDKKIQKGLFSGFFYRLMPKKISHSWVEVELEGEWKRIDAYINDLAYYKAAVKRLQTEGRNTGYSVSFASGSSCPNFNMETEGFVQMDAVTDDQGVWDEPADYYRSPLYRNSPGKLKNRLYRRYIRRVNCRVENLRQNKSLR